jgi:hypothetical protein
VRAAFFTLLLVVIGVPKAWGAQEASSYLVEINATGATLSHTELEARARALLNGFPVVVHWEAREDFRPRDVLSKSDHSTLARIWLDGRDPNRAVLYVVDDEHQRFLVRVIPLEAGFDEVAAESVGTIIQSSVEALLAGVSLGLSRDDAEKQLEALEAKEQPEPEPPSAQALAETKKGQRPPNPAPSSMRIGIELGYRVQFLDLSPTLLHGPELGGSIAAGGRRLFWIGALNLGYRAPVSWLRTSIGARIEGAGFRAGTGLGTEFGKHVRSTLQVTFGVDWFRFTPQAPLSQGKELAKAFDVIAPTLGVAVETEVVLTRVSLWLALGGETDLMGNHYDIIDGGQRVSWLTPLPIQGVIRTGVRFLP